MEFQREWDCKDEKLRNKGKNKAAREEQHEPFDGDAPNAIITPLKPRGPWCIFLMSSCTEVNVVQFDSWVGPGMHWLS